MSAVTSRRSIILFVLASIAAEISGFLRFSSPIEAAVFSLYPADMAACVALSPFARYSATNLVCFGVISYFSQWHPETVLGLATSRKTTELFDGTETGVPEDSPLMSCDALPVTTPTVKADWIFDTV